MNFIFWIFILLTPNLLASTIYSLPEFKNRAYIINQLPLKDVPQETHAISYIRTEILLSEDLRTKSLAHDIEGLELVDALLYLISNARYSKLSQPLQSFFLVNNLAILGPDGPGKLQYITAPFEYYKGFLKQSKDLQKNKLVLNKTAYNRIFDKIYKPIEIDNVSAQRIQWAVEIQEKYPRFPKANLQYWLIHNIINSCQNIGNSSLLEYILETVSPKIKLKDLISDFWSITQKKLKAKQLHPLQELECLRSTVILSRSIQFENIEKKIQKLICNSCQQNECITSEDIISRLIEKYKQCQIKEKK